MRTLALVAFVVSLLGCERPPPPPPPPPPTEVPITSKSPDAIGMFKKARELEETSHPVEAEKLYRIALTFDPTFARAIVALLSFAPSHESSVLIARAKPLVDGLPEGERMFVRMRIAEVEGDVATALALEKELAALLPNDWRVQLALAGRANDAGRFDEALAAFTRVTELRPNAGGAWNSIGYIHLEKDRLEEAVAAFRKYAENSPSDPNAHDSLGDALWRAGKLDDAEASYRKALDIDASFTTAWSGIALTHASRGDWPAALAAMQRYVDATERDIDKPEALLEQSWWLYAAGKKSEAQKKLAEADQAAQRAALDYFGLILVVVRAEMLNGMARHAEALTALDAATARAATIQMPGQRAFFFTTYALGQRLEALAGKKAAADAATVAAELEGALKDQPTTPQLLSLAHRARGDVRVAASDWKGALAEYSACVIDDVACVRRGIWAADRAKDAAAAEPLRAMLKRTPPRHGELVRAFAEAKLFPGP